jgi:hypothetical protein
MYVATNKFNHLYRYSILLNFPQPLLINIGVGFLLSVIVCVGVKLSYGLSIGSWA